MRKLALSLTALGLVLLALLIAAVSLNRIISANREAILGRVEAAIGRSVRVAEITVRFGAGLGVGLKQIEIGEDPAFGREPFVRAQELTAYVRLWPLLRRSWEVGRVVLTAPTIRVVRSVNGQWNYESLGPSSRQAAFPSAVRPVATIVPTEPAAQIGGETVALLIESVAVHDGTVLIVDRRNTPAATTTMRQVDLDLHDVNRQRPIGFQLTAALDSEQANIALGGRVGPLTERARLPVTVQGKLGPFPGMNAVIDGLDLHAFATADTLALERLNGTALAGTFALTGSYALTPGGPVQLAGELRAISVAALLAVRGEPPSRPIEGQGSLRLDLHGTTSAEPLRTLTGTVAVKVTGGALRDFNLINEVLDRISGLPAIGRLISDRIKPKYGRLFGTPNTRFEQLQATLRVTDGRAETDDLTVTAEDFGVRAAGWFTLDRDIDLTGTALMSKRFSDDVLADVKEVRYVLDENGQLAIPFTLRGQLGQAKPKPDTAYFAHLLERAVARGAVGKLVDTLLGGKPGGNKPPATDRPSEALQRRLRDLLGR